ncbi:hypothetical protein EVG20_g654 [Dentipellis fragilis]|uniref:Aldehyde dehydrogenase domain-containing protein n=1 Tax=Dentipellis fragilis TaxID=205917 RepID=A0A4Y9ZEE4_9AGAM|nr:hypothetical protein EVG20_g654 [Dentipellis fragilis]
MRNATSTSFNHGQMCCAGSRIFVQAGIYDEFLQRFTAKARAIRLGDPFAAESDQGPQISQTQYDRIMGYIQSGVDAGARVHYGGNRHGDVGYFVQPTVFVDTKPDMKIVREEIFGPANDSTYGLAAAVFSQDINRAIDTAHRLQAGTAWVRAYPRHVWQVFVCVMLMVTSVGGGCQINCTNMVHPAIPFGGYKQSGIGREMGLDGLEAYTNVKAVHVNLGHSI